MKTEVGVQDLSWIFADLKWVSIQNWYNAQPSISASKISQRCS